MFEPEFLNPKKAKVELLPLIDVMFLLVAFFMVTSISMVLQKGINVDMALSDSSAEVSNKEEDLVLSVKEDGSLYLNKNSFSKSKLTKELKKYYLRNSKRRIFINADKLATHQNVINALDLIRKSGFRNITFTTSPKS